MSDQDVARPQRNNKKPTSSRLHIPIDDITDEDFAKDIQNLHSLKTLDLGERDDHIKILLNSRKIKNGVYKPYTPINFEFANRELKDLRDGLMASQYKSTANDYDKVDDRLESLLSKTPEFMGETNPFVNMQKLETMQNVVRNRMYPTEDNLENKSRAMQNVENERIYANARNDRTMTDNLIPRYNMEPDHFKRTMSQILQNLAPQNPVHEFETIPSVHAGEINSVPSSFDEKLPLLKGNPSGDGQQWKEKTGTISDSWLHDRGRKVAFAHFLQDLKNDLQGGPDNEKKNDNTLQLKAHETKPPSNHEIDMPPKGKVVPDELMELEDVPRHFSNKENSDEKGEQVKDEDKEKTKHRKYPKTKVSRKHDSSFRKLPRLKARGYEHQKNNEGHSPQSNTWQEYKNPLPPTEDMDEAELMTNMMVAGRRDHNDTHFDLTDQGRDRVSLNVTHTSWNKNIHGHRDIIVAGCVVAGVGILLILVAIVNLFMNRRSSNKAFNSNNNKKKYMKLGKREEQAQLQKHGYSLFPMSSEDEDSDEMVYVYEDT